MGLKGEGLLLDGRARCGRGMPETGKQEIGGTGTQKATTELEKYPLSILLSLLEETL